VIPNGDLLSQQLVNWTRDGSSRSVDIITIVSHGADLKKAIRVLKPLPGKDQRVLIRPEPTVIVRDFNSDGVAIQLTFWVRNIRESTSVRSDLLLAIDAAFKENGIEIPKPNAGIRPGEKQENSKKEQNERLHS